MADRVNAIVTTVRRGRRYTEANRVLAARTAEMLGIPNVPRGNASLEELRTQYGADAVLVARRGLLTLVTAEGELFFHPGMAHLRIKNLLRGHGDHLVAALSLAEGMRVLDCTLGTGADAIVESFAVGATGTVTALESNPLIAAVIGGGLARATGDNYEMHAAMRRITVHCTDALDYLRVQPEGSYDAVYFDPMFRRPLHESAGMNALRSLADMRALTDETVAEARRVARQRVVMKERRESGEFARLGFSEIMGGKYSRIAYGVIKI
ncbi:class I SAM-dependent methyltransferase [Selenomonas noxia]